MILDVIVEDKKKRLVEQKNAISEEAMKQEALNLKRQSISFYDALRKSGLSIIGEFKKASPSHGKMDNKIDLTERIRQYSESADAISCLTEEDHFNGSTEYLKQIRSLTNLPIIRKDFIIDEYQVYEAKVIGADAILLIQVDECQKLDKVAGILLDAGVPGSGKTFDWNSIKELEITEKKLFLAGGLNSGNVAAAVKCVQPDVVDISSGVEYEDVLIKGKDESKVKAFINAVNN